MTVRLRLVRPRPRPDATQRGYWVAYLVNNVKTVDLSCQTEPADSLDVTTYVRGGVRLVRRKNSLDL